MWNSVGKAVQGRGHVSENIPCQDKVYSKTANGVNVIALADGAGSAKKSHFGADETVHFICNEISEHFYDYYFESDAAKLKIRLVSKIRERLSSIMDTHDCLLKDLASTLLFAAVRGNHFIIGHLGDGVIGYLKNGEMKLASGPVNGEFVNTTVFTTSAEAVRSLKLIKGNLDEIRGFVLMSDGPEGCLFDRRRGRISFAVGKMMKDCTHLRADAVEAFLYDSICSVIRKRTLDDCSIAFMYDDRDEFPGYRSLRPAERIRLLKLDSRTSRRVLKHYDVLLGMSEFSDDLRSASRAIYQKRNCTEKYVKRLCKLGFLYHQNGRFVCTLKM